MEEQVIINDQTFSLISAQRSGNTAVYSSGDRFLRLGEKERIRSDLKLHREMEANGFPVAKILTEGEHEGLAYFIEASLGGEHFGKLFATDCAREGRISDNTFASFLKIAETHARAQLKTARNERDVDGFKEGINLEGLCVELSVEAPIIRARFIEIQARLSNFPYVLTHGDFNPHNLYPGGVIDLEDSFYGPAGFDLVTNVTHIDYFPLSREYEFFCDYHFADEQKQQYYEAIDSIYKSNGLPKLSDHNVDFEFCRAAWAASGMHQWPKIQQFRYDLLRQKFLRNH